MAWRQFTITDSTRPAWYPQCHGFRPLPLPGADTDSFELTAQYGHLPIGNHAGQAAGTGSGKSLDYFLPVPRSVVDSTSVNHRTGMRRAGTASGNGWDGRRKMAGGGQVMEQVVRSGVGRLGFSGCRAGVGTVPYGSRAGAGRVLYGCRGVRRLRAAASESAAGRRPVAVRIGAGRIGADRVSDRADSSSQPLSQPRSRVVHG